MRRTRIGLTVATVLAATLLVPAPAWAGDVQREEFWRVPSDPWQVIGFGPTNEPDVTARGGALTIGEDTLVMQLEGRSASDWTGSANRLTGWDVDFRMRLGRDATVSCSAELGGTPATLVWLGDNTELMQLGFGPGELCITHPYADQESIPLDTQRWHRYQVEARGKHVRIRVDGRTVVDREFSGTGQGTVGVGFETHEGTSTWDWFRYDTAPEHRCTVRGTAGADTLRGTRGADVICAGDGDDRLLGLGGDDVLIGGDGDDTLLGGDGGDLLQGGLGDDTLDNGTGNGRAEGGFGDDRFVTGAAPDGAQQLAGGPGHDVADYSARTGGVTIALDGNGGDGAPGEGDAVGAGNGWGQADVEEVRGGHGDDVLTGSPWSSTLVGGPGADRLRGRDSADVLDGVDGVEGNDVLDGGGGPDTCTADPADEVLACNDPSPSPTPTPRYTMPPPPPTSPAPSPSRPPLTTPSPSGSPVGTADPTAVGTPRPTPVTTP
ncbi:calcium-binding protein [Cellulomonas shaoxiangyii]|uniref:Calcium-binding protein n=1 Tax=Cellulomonas shaoxiangyii TaxID=2566013 RepID=A0A4P7SGG2_9CELL|nr:hypothetical protein [Cellulomonas shaoxiangyii]QCB92708.1 hypothetical protein E5225_03215 [Cellulomonas shaoxiangyii]TGY85834.1 hypothetical protein E5226_04660 [Cellulomonas shaoxiangyii]